MNYGKHEPAEMYGRIEELEAINQLLLEACEALTLHFPRFMAFEDRYAEENHEKWLELMTDASVAIQKGNAAIAAAEEGK